MKLVKLNDHRFVIVTKSNIELGTYCLLFDDFGNLFGGEPQLYLGEEHGQFLNKGLWGVTHSTEPLGDNNVPNLKEVLPLDFNQIRELIGEVNVDLEVYDSVCEYGYENSSQLPGYITGFYNGYQKSLDNNKDKVSTEQILRWLKTRFTKNTPIEYVISEFEKGDYKFPVINTWDVVFNDDKLELVK